MRYYATAAELALTALVALSSQPIVLAAGQQPNLLLNGGAEIGKADKPSIWFAACVPAKGLKMYRDTKDARSGKACLTISNQHKYPEPVANNWAQDLQVALRRRTIRLTAWIRTLDADAANVCVQCWSPGGKRMLAFASTPVFRGTNGWTQVRSQDVVVPPETARITIRAALMGTGTASFDDIALRATDSPILPPGDRELAAMVQGEAIQAIPVTRDCMVLAYLPNWSHGDVNNLSVANNSGGVRTLVDWQAVPKELLAQPKLRFVLAMYARETRIRPPAGRLAIHKVLEPWPERCSWKKMPAFETAPVATFDLVSGKGWKLFDLTSFVRKSGTSRSRTHGVVLRFVEENAKRDWSGYGFVSREGLGWWENRRPMLLVIDPSRQPASQPASRRTGADVLEYVEYLATLPHVKITAVPGSAGKFREAMTKANEALSQEGLGTRGHDPAVRKAGWAFAVRHYEQFVDEYPLTPHGLRMMNTLAYAYSQHLKRHDDARRLLHACIALAGSDSIAEVAETELAEVDIRDGKLADAETRVRRLVSRPLPDSLDDSGRSWAAILKAPQLLAQIFERKGRADQADRVLADSVEKNFALYKANPRAGWLASYVARAYTARIGLSLRQNPSDEAARKLAEEFKRRLPDYDAPVGGHADMMQMIRYAARLRAKPGLN
ncbi:MAG: hypothetical protein ACYS5V_10600 [Planctomycetota bacterium]|jgi:hypothetical protein